MIYTIYYFILAYFVLGGLGFYFINRRKRPEVARKSYIKFFTYFVIINILFFSIVIHTVVFQGLLVLIIIAGYLELFRLLHRSNYKKTGIYLFSFFVYSILSLGFIFFGTLEKTLILYSFILISIFDSFSQITGQLWGRTKVFHHISPKKTAEGLIGGVLMAMISISFLYRLFPVAVFDLIFLTLGLIVFAIAGDLAASLYKRKFGVKDFSKLIPGHGGFLDRFDSLIAGGAWVAFYALVIGF